MGRAQDPRGHEATTTDTTHCPAGREPEEATHGNAAALEELRGLPAGVDDQRQGDAWRLRLWGFDVDSDALQSEHLGALAAFEDSLMAQVLAGASGWSEAQVTGHASPEGEEDHDQALAERRALSVGADFPHPASVSASGEGCRTSADAADFPWHRAVDLEVEVLRESDTTELEALMAEREALEGEIAELEVKARWASAIGEDAAETGCNDGQLSNPNDTWWQAGAKIINNMEPPEPGGCLMGQAAQDKLDSRAATHREAIAELESQRDELIDAIRNGESS